MRLNKYYLVNSILWRNINVLKVTITFRSSSYFEHLHIFLYVFEHVLRQNGLNNLVCILTCKSFAFVAFVGLANPHENTYTTFSELLCINGWSEIETPCIIGHWILPVNKAFWCLTNACAWKKLRRIFKVWEYIKFWYIYICRGYFNYSRVSKRLEKKTKNF